MNLGRYVIQESPDHFRLNLLVDGMHCPSCVSIIESAMHKHPDVTSARLNLSTRRLAVTWQGNPERGGELAAQINAMGYRAVAFDPASEQTETSRYEKTLLRCLAVAGFATGNLMLLSIPLWTSDAVQMGDGTRTLFHWLQAAVAIPAIAYCGQPFFRSAWSAIRLGKGNMDVPISIAVILAAAMSLFETTTHGAHSYFDSGVMLLFFLLIGRYLEARARGRARGAAQDLLSMMQGEAMLITATGTQEKIALADIKQGMILQIAAGEKIGADGIIIQGQTDIDSSLITGETLPMAAQIGSDVFAGTLNLSQSIRIQVSKPHEQSLLADIIRLMETAEQSQARYVTLADQLAGWYTPAVHALAALTFAGWLVLGHVAWQVALLYAATVLIITCPCALGLAVPVVQVLASSRLMRAGILLKSGSALERLASITHAVFDKTGTLTLGSPTLLSAAHYDTVTLQLAASMASHSRHPLSKAISSAYQGNLITLDTQEIQGCGLETSWQSQTIRFGKRSWVCPDLQGVPDQALELWLSGDQIPPVRFTFSDHLRSDAEAIIDELQRQGIHVLLLSGDRREVAESVAQTLHIKTWEGGLSPLQKTEHIAALIASGARVLMVGDGLNDAPSLASATVSMSPTSAIDITQNTADIVFQGNKLEPVLTAWRIACHSQKLVRQNFLLAIGYNIIAIPMAVAGMVTPLIAAIAMSSSSLVVIANAMRLYGRGARK